jgi:hypothetical protein
MGQPFRDLSLVREVAPEVLQRAAAGPYDVARIASCAAAQAEVADLDAALGPDLEPDGKASGLTVQGLAADLLGGAKRLVALLRPGEVSHDASERQSDRAAEEIGRQSLHREA